MADINAIEWFYLISSSVIALLTFSFSSTMTAAFFRKRSIGSSFMMVAFGFIAMSETFFSISLWLRAFNAASLESTGILQALYINLLCLAIVYFYYFSTRHILRDNELVKSLIIVFSVEIIVVVTTLMFTKVLGGSVAIEGAVKFALGGTDIEIFAPIWYMLIILFSPLVQLMLMRMNFNLTAIHRKITDAVAKRGTIYINYSVIALTMSVSFLTPFLIPQVNNIAWLAIILQILRLISTAFAMVIGYLGWIFPEWLKKRIRSKAWIVQAFKKIEGQEINYKFSSSKDSHVQKLEVQEVSEP